MPKMPSAVSSKTERKAKTPFKPKKPSRLSLAKNRKEKSVDTVDAPASSPLLAASDVALLEQSLGADLLAGAEAFFNATISGADEPLVTSTPCSPPPAAARKDIIAMACEAAGVDLDSSIETIDLDSSTETAPHPPPARRGKDMALASRHAAPPMDFSDSSIESIALESARTQQAVAAPVAAPAIGAPAPARASFLQKDADDRALAEIAAMLVSLPSGPLFGHPAYATHTDVGLQQRDAKKIRVGVDLDDGYAVKLQLLSEFEGRKAFVNLSPDEFEVLRGDDTCFSVKRLFYVPNEVQFRVGTSLVFTVLNPETVKNRVVRVWREQEKDLEWNDRHFVTLTQYNWDMFMRQRGYLKYVTTLADEGRQYVRCFYEQMIDTAVEYFRGQNMNGDQLKSLKFGPRLKMLHTAFGQCETYLDKMYSQKIGFAECINLVTVKNTLQNLFTMRLYNDLLVMLHVTPNCQ